MAYNSHGKRIRSENLAGQVTTTAWDQFACTSVDELISAAKNAKSAKHAYTYDAAGRRVACAKSGTAFEQSDSVNYGYNKRSELTNATAAVDSDYRYGYDFDDIGNRKTSSERGTNSVYTASQLNQYTAVDDFTPVYDADGNQTLVKTATGIWQVIYNGENRPVQWMCLTNLSNVSNLSNLYVISMTYDRMGRRVTKNDQRFVYNGYLQIASFEHSNNRTFEHFFIWDPTESVATRPLVWQRGNSDSYYTHDGNKNVSEVIASDGTSVAHYEYAPFGALTISRGESAAANPWRFSSEYAEDDTATVYYNYRHYEPVTGRWMSRDRCLLTPLNQYLLLANFTFGIDCLGKYDEWVHYYLMYLLMRRYGLDERQAKVLAEGSQYPDGVNLLDSVFGNKFDAMNIRVLFTRKYQETLHNLNGLETSELEKYQRCIRCAVLNDNGIDEMHYFKVGVLLHALGDTYAHFKLVKGQGGHSYYKFIGHVSDGTDPDNPLHNIQRFRYFLQDVEKLIGRNRNYGLADDVYRYMSSPAWIYWDEDGYYFPPKVLSYKDQIVQLYTAKHIRFEKMTVQRTIERKSAVEDLVGKLQECLKKAGDPE